MAEVILCIISLCIFATVICADQVHNVLAKYRIFFFASSFILTTIDLLYKHNILQIIHSYITQYLPT